MTLDKAVQLQEAYLRNPLCNLTADERDAAKLGIEALNRCKNFRDNSLNWGYQSLPGETEE